ncbi:MAG: rhombosortase [Pseudomonadota bacterium]
MTAPDPVHSPRYRPEPGFSFLIGIAAIIGLSALLPASAADLFAFLRSKLPGEAWRAISAHLVHLNAAHALMNAAALALLAALFGRFMKTWQWLTFWLTASVFVSVGLWWWLPGLERYVGASGVLHGVAVLGGVVMFKPHRLEASLLLVGLLVKIGWEIQFGAADATADMIGGAVIEQAHWLGALYGAVVACGWVIFRRASRL